MHVQLEFLADGLDILQTLLIVGTCSTNPDRGLVLNQCGCEFPQGANDTLESGSDLWLLAHDCNAGSVTYVCEIGNTAADKQDLAFRVHRSTEHEV